MKHRNNMCWESTMAVGTSFVPSRKRKRQIFDANSQSSKKFIKAVKDNMCTSTEPWQCQFCNAPPFKMKGSLVTHTVSHFVEFVCETCQAKYSRSATLDSHKKNHDSQHAKQHACKNCNKVLSRKKILESHVLQCTGKPGKFNCLDCGKNFHDKGTFKNHLKIHQRITFTCPKCPTVLLTFDSSQGCDTRRTTTCDSCGHTYRRSQLARAAQENRSWKKVRRTRTGPVSRRMLKFKGFYKDHKTIRIYVDKSDEISYYDCTCDFTRPLPQNRVYYLLNHAKESHPQHYEEGSTPRLTKRDPDDEIQVTRSANRYVNRPPPDRSDMHSRPQQPQQSMFPSVHQPSQSVVSLSPRELGLDTSNPHAKDEFVRGDFESESEGYDTEHSSFTSTTDAPILNFGDSSVGHSEMDVQSQYLPVPGFVSGLQEDPTLVPDFELGGGLEIFPKDEADLSPNFGDDLFVTENDFNMDCVGSSMIQDPCLAPPLAHGTRVFFSNSTFV